jgi:hypothetical protein
LGEVDFEGTALFLEILELTAAGAKGVLAILDVGGECSALILEARGFLVHEVALVAEGVDALPGIGDFGLGLAPALKAGGDIGTSLGDELIEFIEAGAEGELLTFVGLEELLLGGEGDANLGEGGGGGFALLAKGFELAMELVQGFLTSAFFGFGRGDLAGEGGAFGPAFLFLSSEALDFEEDGIDFLVEDPEGVFEDGDLAFMGGDGHLTGLEVGLAGLESGLSGGLLARPPAFRTTGLGHPLLECAELLPELGDVVFAAED